MMFAVVEIAGMQFEVSNQSIVKVPLLEGNPGDTLNFNKILLAGEGSDLKLGKPYIEGNVQATLIKHGHDPKVFVFKKIRRKGYRRFKGHRQKFSLIEINDINA